MRMEEKHRVFAMLKTIIAGLGKALGSNCELVLHDFSKTEDSIIAIENNAVTGREVGDGLDELSFNLLQHNPNPPDLFNYRGHRNGKTLRSSSILLRDESNKAFGALGVNIDITALLAAQDTLTNMTSIQELSVEETFERSVREVLEKYLTSAVKHVGKDPLAMDKADKIKLLKYLDQRDAFLIRYSIDRVTGLLNISRYTLYTYLEEARRDSPAKPAVGL
jgi:predicted transcriptional regulator YheO